MTGNRSSGIRGEWDRAPQVGRQLHAVARRDPDVAIESLTSWRGGLAGRSMAGSVIARSLRAAAGTAGRQLPGTCDDRRMPDPADADEPRPVANGPWLRRSRRVAYENAWVTVWHDEVTRPDGEPGIYGLVHFANLAVGVVVLDD